MKILDVCCGSKMFYFDKDYPDVTFCDKRVVERFEYYPERFIEVNPDIVCDFTDLPFEDNTYDLVIFDPPHLTSIKETAFMFTKYGKLDADWRTQIHKGFCECFRVMKDTGALVFKWNEVDIPVSDIVKLAPAPPPVRSKDNKGGEGYPLARFRQTEGRNCRESVRPSVVGLRG